MVRKRKRRRLGSFGYDQPAHHRIAIEMRQRASVMARDARSSKSCSDAIKRLVDASVFAGAANANAMPGRLPSSKSIGRFSLYRLGRHVARLCKLNA